MAPQLTTDHHFICLLVLKIREVMVWEGEVAVPEDTLGNLRCEKLIE